VTADGQLRQWVAAILADDIAAVGRQLTAAPDLATAAFQTGAERQSPENYFLPEIERYIYAGDTALHIAAAAYRPPIVQVLLTAGADVRARNRRGAEPLHAAAVGNPNADRWNAQAQVETIICLIAAGADPNATDKDGATPLHRAVRTRCAAAVRALVAHGADPMLRNKGGSTPLALARVTSGWSGGAGTPAARAEQADIIAYLESLPA
jgi:hypothetical protein